MEAIVVKNARYRPKNLNFDSKKKSACHRQRKSCMIQKKQVIDQTNASHHQIKYKSLTKKFKT